MTRKSRSGHQGEEDEDEKEEVAEEEVEEVEEEEGKEEKVDEEEREVGIAGCRHRCPQGTGASKQFTTEQHKMKDKGCTGGKTVISTSEAADKCARGVPHRGAGARPGAERHPRNRAAHKDRPGRGSVGGCHGEPHSQRRSQSPCEHPESAELRR